MQRQRHLADLVEKNRPAGGRLQQAALLLLRVREGPPLVAEELALEQSLGQRRAGDVHEGPRGPRARVVNHLRGQVLPGAALAGEKHGRGRARRYLAEQFLDPGDDRGVADDAVEAVRLPLARANRPQFPPQPGGFERLAHQQRDLVQIERLRDVVVGALLHDGNGRLDIGIRGEDDDEDIGVPPTERLQNVEAVRVAETVVEEHEVDGVAEARERLPSRFRFDRGVSLGRQALGERPADQALVVGYQDRRLAHRWQRGRRVPFERRKHFGHARSVIARQHVADAGCERRAPGGRARGCARPAGTLAAAGGIARR